MPPANPTAENYSLDLEFNQFCIKDEKDTELDHLLLSKDLTLAKIGYCVEILDCFHDERGKQLLRHEKLKPLRRALLPLIEDFRQSLFHGQDPNQYSLVRREKREVKRKKMQQAATDQVHINKTKLRASRIASLQKLTDKSPNTPKIPDGCTSIENTSMLEEGVVTPEVTTDIHHLHQLRSCYTCKIRFSQLHHFYDQLCPTCASFNFSKRIQSADLSCRIAIVTGGRVKIGYQTVLKLLRSGATVIATTRFPRDAAKRYINEKDFSMWKNKLHIYGLDLRNLAFLDIFIDHIRKKFHVVDILINNATQTVRRPTQYYQHLLKEEHRVSQTLLERQLLIGNEEIKYSVERTPTIAHTSAQTTHQVTTPSSLQIPSSTVPLSVMMSSLRLLEEDHLVDNEHFPVNQTDINEQQLDLRRVNSWKLKLEEVETPELAEVFAINVLAPFIINRKVISLMTQSSFKEKFIVNVSAMEGKFYRHKTPFHPHTNMAKAALNMMTRTSSEDLKEKNIYMNSVDTGWINDENPRHIAETIAIQHNFQTPLDEIDAASRILDPIMVAINEGQFFSGEFLKDYCLSEW